MRYRLLGPLEVLDGDRVVSVGSGRRLSLLALLLIDANEVVPADRLIDELWGESPPPTATKSLQVRVSQLRRALGQGGADPSGGPLLTYGNGYLLRVGEDELDSRRFELGLDSGSRALAAGEARRAAALLDDALALWRGSPLTGVEYEPFAQREIARLEELRVMAFEVRMDAALELGEHARAVGELESLVQRHPLRERFRAQLMLALYRSGRQAEALASYRDARQVSPRARARSRRGAEAAGGGDPQAGPGAREGGSCARGATRPRFRAGAGRPDAGARGRAAARAPHALRPSRAARSRRTACLRPRAARAGRGGCGGAGRARRPRRPPSPNGAASSSVAA